MKHPLLAHYADKRIGLIFVNGILSGMPWIFIASALNAWLVDLGIELKTIAYIGAIGAAYAFNFLWSPLIDRVLLPKLGKLGQRRSWLLLCQTLIFIALLLIGFVINPQQGLSYLVLCALLIAFASATADIVIDAYRIDVFHENEASFYPAAAAMATAGWWTGYAGLGAIPFWLAKDIGWQGNYQYFATGYLLVLLYVWFLPEPNNRRERQQQVTDSYQQQALQWLNQSHSRYVVFALVFALAALPLLWQLWAVALPLMLVGIWLVNYPHPERIIGWILATLVEPIANFIRRNGLQVAIAVLSFVFLFKIGEAFLGRMSIAFYKEIGFTDAEIGTYSKFITWWATIIFSVIGSMIQMRRGIIMGLFIGGIAMAASNLMFAVIASHGPDTRLLMWAVIIDGFTSAFASVAFVAFLSLLVDRNFSASQYALLASLGTASRTLLASYSGVMVKDWFDGDWAQFFVATALMVTPSLLILLWLRRRLRFND